MAAVETTSMLEQIGKTAGDVWHLLLEQGQLTFAQLAKEVDAPRDRVMQAVGWLAREEKVCIQEQARKRVIALR